MTGFVVEIDDGDIGAKLGQTVGKAAPEDSAAAGDDRGSSAEVEQSP